MFGVDVSEHNGEVDFDVIKKSGFDFAIIRCGYGDDIDANFYSNVYNAKQAGLKIGAYHYSYALTPERAEYEGTVANQIISNSGELFELPIFFDIESDSYKKRNMFNTEHATDICKAFLNSIKLNAGVYSSYDWLRNVIDWKSLNCPIWSAEWNTTDDFKGYMWQFSDNWDIHGKSFDVNYLYGEL